MHIKTSSTEHPLKHPKNALFLGLARPRISWEIVHNLSSNQESYDLIFVLELRQGIANLLQQLNDVYKKNYSSQNLVSIIRVCKLCVAS